MENQKRNNGKITSEKYTLEQLERTRYLQKIPEPYMIRDERKMIDFRKNISYSFVLYSLVLGSFSKSTILSLASLFLSF